MSKHVFVTIFSDSCSHCKYFKDIYWSNLEKKIKEGNKLQVVEITLKTQADLEKMKKDYPLDLSSYLNWYPMFLCFTGSSWERAKNNGQEKLSGVMFNGPAIKKDNSFAPSGNTLYTDTNILAWLEYQLNQPMFNDISIYSKGSNSTTSTKKSKNIRYAKSYGNKKLIPRTLD